MASATARFLRKLKTPARMARNYIFFRRFLFEYRNELGEIFNQFEIISFEPLKLIEWHDDCRYFVGRTQAGRKFFFKIGGGFGTVLNEANILRDLNRSEEGMAFFPELRLYQKVASYDLLMIDFIDSETLEPKLKRKRFSISEGRQILRAFSQILKILHLKKIVHRDVRPNNIFIVSCEPLKVVLFDFGLAVQDNKEPLRENKKILSYLGEEFRAGPSHWDDAHSFKEIAKLIIGSNSIEEYPEYYKLESMVGRRTFTLN